MGFQMVIVPPNMQPDWPEKICAVVPDCDVQLFHSAEAAFLGNCQRFNAGRLLHNVVDKVVDKANWF